MKMETQQMMERLLARFNASMKDMQEISTEMKADRKSDQEQMLAEISTRMDANTNEMNANQAEMRSIVNAWMTDMKDA
jgi:hypothetical protein